VRRGNRFDAWMRSVGTEPDPRFTLANERTFLAWTTTSLGLLGIGLALGSLLPDETPLIRGIAAAWIVLAAVVVLRAFVRWLVLERALRRGEALPLSGTIVWVAVAMAVLGLATGLALLSGT
jgi:putative membrane protein